MSNKKLPAHPDDDDQLITGLNDQIEAKFAELDKTTPGLSFDEVEAIFTKKANAINTIFHSLQSLVPNEFNEVIKIALETRLHCAQMELYETQVDWAINKLVRLSSNDLISDTLDQEVIANIATQARRFTQELYRLNNEVEVSTEFLDTHNINIGLFELAAQKKCAEVREKNLIHTPFDSIQDIHNALDQIRAQYKAANPQDDSYNKKLDTALRKISFKTACRMATICAESKDSAPMELYKSTNEIAKLFSAAGYNITVNTKCKDNENAVQIISTKGRIRNKHSNKIILEAIKNCNIIYNILKKAGDSKKAFSTYLLQHTFSLS